MKASDYIAEFLVRQGVTAVYEMTGGMITHLLDSLGARADVDVVSVHHEQSAAFAAEGRARVDGIPGVALATSGPGATNLLTGVGSCYFDSVPAVFITGQVNTNEQCGESGVRQAGFQETDIVAIASPITKWAVRVRSAHELPEVLTKAFQVALSGRRGPVLVDIPMNVQREGIDSHAPSAAPRDRQHVDVQECLDALASARRPLILAGGGVAAAGARELLLPFARALRIPVATTLMGLDVIAHAETLRVGMIGTYGNRWANLTLRDADCVLALGARFDVRQTGADVDAFVANKRILRVDIDERQLAWRVVGDVSVHADIGDFLHEALAAVDGIAPLDTDDWLAQIDAHRAAWPEELEASVPSGVAPGDAIRAVIAAADTASAVIADVGQNQMWAAQSARLRAGQRFLTSGGMGAMGFALPAAIGAASARPGHPVVVVVGDGGMQVNIQELETVARLRIPLKMLVLNNRSLGMVRQLQDELFQSRYQSTVWGYGAPDFVAVAQAYGVAARRVEAADALEDAARWLADDPSSAALLEVIVDQQTCVRPKVAFGNPVYVMDPPAGAIGHGH